jgi:peptide chain release factor 3
LRLFEVCRLRDIPIMTLINKMDREAKDPIELLDEIHERLALDVAPMNWPIGMGQNFRGVFDLLRRHFVLMAEGNGLDSEDVVTERGNSLAARVPEAQRAELDEQLALVEGALPAFSLDSYREGHLTPVFFGSALRNFGIRALLDCLAAHAPSPRPQPAEPRAVDPGEDNVSGFVFKVQANMDPKHRDRVAFVRLCSGRFQRGMKLNMVRHARPIAISSPIFFFAREREIVEEAWPGDIIGVPNHGQLRVGDALSEGEPLRFTGIPSFAPEILMRVRLGDPMRAKHLKVALEDLAEEGVTQVFRPLLSAEWIVGVVGQLQLDVLQTRLEAEYNLPIAFEAAPYVTARWCAAGDSKELDRFLQAKRASLALDRDGNTVFLARNGWDLGRVQEDFPQIRFAATHEPH